MENKKKQANFKVGDTFTDVYPPEAAAWCNINNCHIEAAEKANYKYIIVENQPYTPTQEELLSMKEEEYGMNRLTREGILGNPSAYSEFSVKRAQEVEAMAVVLREKKAKEAEQEAKMEKAENL